MLDSRSGRAVFCNIARLQGEAELMNLSQGGLMRASGGSSAWRSSAGRRCLFVIS